MTDPSFGQNTGGGAAEAPEPYVPSALTPSGRRRLAADALPGSDAHSPASPYTFTSEPRPARALPPEDDDAPLSPSGSVGTPVAFLPAPPAPPAPVAPVLSVPVLSPAPVAVPPALPDPALPAALVDPAPPTAVSPVEVASTPALSQAGTDDEDDVYVEPPIVPRPYAVATPTFAPAPPVFKPPVPEAATTETVAPTASLGPLAQPRSLPFQQYSSPVPPPAARHSSATPYSAASAAEAPPVMERFYAQPVGAHTSAPLSPAPEYLPTDAFPGIGPVAPQVPAGFGSARPRTENIGRGLLFSLVAVLAGCVLSAVVYHLGFVASIVALAMGAAGIYLYSKGAGTPPRKGAVALVVLLMAGILLAWVCSVGTELYFLYVDQNGSADGALPFVLSSVFSVDLFEAMIKDFLIFVGFGALGIFGVARQLLVPPRRK